MGLKARVITSAVRVLLRILCSYDRRAFDAIPQKGPALIVLNHINFLDVPIVSSLLFPRMFHGLVKQETWDNPVLRQLTEVWGGIPVDRSQPQIATFRTVHEILDQGSLLCIAPEGTRSTDGILKRGKSGPAAIAMRAQVPVYPVALHGTEQFWKNFKRLRRTAITIRLGTPFMIRETQGMGRKAARQEVSDQIMMQIASLMPPEYRGAYSDEQAWRDDLLEFSKET